jgi:hypothetical protein
VQGFRQVLDELITGGEHIDEVIAIRAHMKAVTDCCKACRSS